ncbi:fasciclin-3 isoform X3 [Bradysia coprophila]|uniref:fasciclin-3 isoform X3 n=1 Tax=Bradysia coprophila TaxID=38358 RepID=UPI00187D9770|nr:fasciclin-3 isoform X3 [Bradysia coprophila]
MEVKLGLKNFNILMLIAIAVFSTDIKSVQGQRVDVQPRNVTALEGEKADILCRWGKPLQYCRIVIPNEKALNLSPDWDKTPGFQYFGEGLNKGQCGVSIQSVRNGHHGTVKCYLGADGEELEGQIGLTVALAPLRPELELYTKSETGAYQIGQQFHAACISRDGRPPSNITFYLDDEPITEGVEADEIIESIASKNTMLYTTRKQIRRYIQASDDRRTLICRSHHIADRGQPQEARMQFQVRFQPQPLPEIKVYGVILGSDAVINATIKANPRPRTEWIVDGIAIPQGTQNGRYESYEPIDLGSGVFNVSLTIASLTLEDTTKMYYLKASNEFGTQEYSVRISSSEAAAVNGLDTAAIIGIVVGVAVLIIIVVLVVVARATGKWCFAGKGNTSSKPQGSETDTESADLKQSKFKKYQINFEGLFKKKPQKVVDVEKNNAEAPTDDPNDDAAPSEATVIIEDDPPKSGERNLVYAELMLKPSEDANNPNKNATEYAEIVYVNPPSDQKQPDKK